MYMKHVIFGIAVFDGLNQPQQLFVRFCLLGAFWAIFTVTENYIWRDGDGIKLK